MTVDLTRLTSPDPVCCQAGRAIAIFPYVLIRENSDCYATLVDEVRMPSNFAQGDYLPKGTKLSPGLKERIFFQHHPIAPLASQPDGQQPRPRSFVTAIWLCAHDLTLEGDGTD